MRTRVVPLLLATALLVGCSFFEPPYSCTLGTLECRRAVTTVTQFIAEGGVTDREGALRIVAIDAWAPSCPIGAECPIGAPAAVVHIRFASGAEANLLVCFQRACSEDPRLLDFTPADR